jgi:hypothetical protein
MRLLTRVLPGLLVFVLVGCATEPFREDYLVMTIGVGWKVARSQEERNVRRMKEYVREGETLDNWTELITWQSFKKGSNSVPPETAVNRSREFIQAICPGVVWNIIERKEKVIVYEWRISNCNPGRVELETLAKSIERSRLNPKVELEKLTTDQHIINLYTEGEWTIWIIGYTAKVKELSKEKRAEWIQRFLDARVETQSR